MKHCVKGLEQKKKRFSATRWIAENTKTKVDSVFKLKFKTGTILLYLNVLWCIISQWKGKPFYTLQGLEKKQVTK